MSKLVRTRSSSISIVDQSELFGLFQWVTNEELSETYTTVPLRHLYKVEPKDSKVGEIYVVCVEGKKYRAKLLMKDTKANCKEREAYVVGYNADMRLKSTIKSNHKSDKQTSKRKKRVSYSEDSSDDSDTEITNKALDEVKLLKDEVKHLKELNDQFKAQLESSNIEIESLRSSLKRHNQQSFHSENSKTLCNRDNMLAIVKAILVEYGRPGDLDELTFRCDDESAPRTMSVICDQYPEHRMLTSSKNEIVAASKSPNKTDKVICRMFIYSVIPHTVLLQNCGNEIRSSYPILKAGIAFLHSLRSTINEQTFNGVVTQVHNEFKEAEKKRERKRQMTLNAASPSLNASQSNEHRESTARSLSSNVTYEVPSEHIYETSCTSSGSIITSMRNVIGDVLPDLSCFD